MILVSPTNNNGTDTEFILRVRSFIYIQTTEAPEMILGEFHVPRYPSYRKNFESNEMILLQLCLLLVKQDLNQYKCNLIHKISKFMQSKAFAKSQKIPLTCIFWFLSLRGFISFELGVFFFVCLF